MALTQAEVDIANMSLGRIGGKQITLASCTAGTRPEDDQINLHFAHTRDGLLRVIAPNFAVKRFALSSVWAANTSYAVGQYVWIDLSTYTITPTITAFADYSGTVSGTVKVTTSAAHGLKTGMYVTISGTTSYNGSYYVTYIDADDFYITETWVADDATGSLAYTATDILFKCATAHTSGLTGTFTTDLTAAKWTINISRPSFGYSYQYDLPSDCLRFRKTDIDDFEVEGLLFMADEQKVDIKYIYQCTTTTSWDTLFYECMILKLALNILHPLAGTNVTALRQLLEQELRETMTRTKMVTKQETNSTGEESWNNARFL